MKNLYKRSIFENKMKSMAVIGLVLASALIISQLSAPQANAVADKTSPSVSITSPVTGSTILSKTSIITIQGTSYDDTRGSGVNAIEVKVDGGSYLIAKPKTTGDWSFWTASVDVKTSESHRITARATDNAGNQAWNSIDITVIVDSIAPSVTVSSPVAGATILTGSLSVRGTASDNSGGSGVSILQVRLDSGSYITAVPRATGDWSTWSASLNIATTGAHTIYALAKDKVGNQRLTSLSITSASAVQVDTTAPSVTITSPAANSAIAVSGGSTIASGTSSDSGSGVKVVEVKVDSGAYSAASPKALGDWSTWKLTVSISAGNHQIMSRATDNAGNQAWNSIYVTVSDSTSGSSGTQDKFGIKKIYPTASGGNEWYVNMDNPKSDTNFRNLPTMTKQTDGSWQVSASQVRMEAWSPSDEKWLNVEITGYAKMISGTNELIQWYSRGGHHTDSNQCLGSAYKARLYGTGEARWVKEITHPAYTGSKGSMQATDDPLKGRWVGFKAVIYNFVENGKTYVRMESYIDDDVTDSKGNLVVGNNWKLAAVYEDKGGWSTTNSDFNASCFPVNKDSTQQYRQRDEIINMSGGTSTQNIAAWRSDGLTWNWKYLSVREIVPPT